MLLFGALKWTQAEARGIEPFLAHSAAFAWLLPTFGLQRASELVGIIELSIAVMIALRPWSPRVAALGSLMATAMFVTTLSFLVTTPMIDEAAGFLLKDVTLLGAALWSAGEALKAVEA